MALKGTLWRRVWQHRGLLSTDTNTLDRSIKNHCFPLPLSLALLISACRWWSCPHVSRYCYNFHYSVCMSHRNSFPLLFQTLVPIFILRLRDEKGMEAIIITHHLPVSCLSVCVCVSLSVMDFRVNNSDPRWQKGNVYHCQLFSAVATPGPNAAHCVQGLWSCSYTKHWHVNTQKEIRRGISVKGFYAPCVSWRFYFSLFYHTDKTVSVGRHKRK